MLKCSKLGSVAKLLHFYGGFVVVLREGCGVSLDSQKLKSVIVRVFYDSIWLINGVFNGFL